LASNSREITQSNAAVIVFLPGQEIRDTYTPNVALADGIESTISYWVDYRGFVHSVDVLRRQLKKLDFYKGLDGFRPMTGILDRETLWSESVILNRELRYAHQKLLRACMDAAGEKTSCAAPPWPQEENLKACMDAAGEKTSCDAPPWPNSEIQLAEDAQQRAVYALSRYDGELRSVQFAAPTGRPAACDSAPRLYYDAPSGHLIGQFKNDSYLGGGPYPTTYNHDLQDGITEAVDPRAFDAVLGQKLAELESEARKRTHEATALVDTVVSMNPK
jgi:hypothetical protein